mmetsp:Transcript_8845/g.21100  ORF Transcript_8845/g.21100 Transcript_8845/m.21100 type:complete len:1235 (+) Transcript_8845:46-3750(+)
MLSPAEQSLVGRLVDVSGEHEVVGAKATAQVPARGQVIGWAPEEQQRYLVRTFDGLMLHAPVHSVTEVPPGQDSFDVVWPDGDDLPSLGKEVASCLAKQTYCVVQCFVSPEVGLQALKTVRRQGGWQRFIKELEPSYLGLKSQGKILWMPSDDPRREVTTPVESCDRVLSKLAAGLYLECQDSLGFRPDGRSDSLFWLPPKSRSEEEGNLRRQERLSEEHARSGRIEDHIDFVQTRKVCLLYQVLGSAKVELQSPEIGEVSVDLRRGQVLAFRHDLLKFSHEGSTDSLAMMTWIFSTGLAAEIQQHPGIIGQEADFASGVISGPLAPVNPKTGKTVSIMATDCMLAGNGVSPDQYWAMLASGTDGCRHLSSLRWDTEAYFEPNKDWAIGKYYSNHGGFVMEEYIMGFDAPFFGYSDEQASLMDPIQRNTLEVGYSILLKAGWDRKRLANADIGVYVGNCGTDWSGVKNAYYGEYSSHSLRDMIAFSIEANSAHSTSSRLSYIFGMRGPISTSDTACSSSLVATGEAHNALRQLDPGQKAVNNTGTEHALVIGTNGLFGPFSWIGLCGPKMLSAKGRCFTFDYGADGFGRGEGTSGIFAQVTHKEPTDRLAIFCGTSINQDGRSASMTAPHGPSQQECIRASLREANVTPADIRVAELHGTGTALGDPIEVGALRGVMKDRSLPIFKTSAKSNLAHGEANAGMAGLVKCTLMLNHHGLAPNVHFYCLNPHVDANGYPCQISGELLDFGTNSGYAGVSSFGFGGTNARADIWAKATVGARRSGKLDFNMLENVYVRCPQCLGGMEWKSACAVPARVQKSKGRGRTPAKCIRETDNYDVCSFCYDGAYIFGHPDPEEPLSSGPAYIKGTWTAFTEFEQMKMEDGVFTFQLRLGETRLERFYIAMQKKDENAIFPWEASGQPFVRPKGPCPLESGHYFTIDGRDEEWSEGSLINIKFWTEGAYNERKISWEMEPEDGGPKEMASFTHSYQVMGSLTQMKLIPMKAVRGLRNVFEYSTRLGLQSFETFQFVRDHDRTQAIYPARHLPKSSGVPVRGPDAAGKENFFAVRGRQGERVMLRLEVSDGHVTVSSSQLSGTRTWHSQEGRARKRFSVAGSWLDHCVPMEQDANNPDRYFAQMTVASRSCLEEFQILLDEDPNRAIFPSALKSTCGGSMVHGPEEGRSDHKFVIEGYPGTCFEICLDLKSINRWRTVVWTKIPTGQLTAGEAFHAIADRAAVMH